PAVLSTPGKSPGRPLPPCAAGAPGGPGAPEAPGLPGAPGAPALPGAPSAPFAPPAPAGPWALASSAALIGASFFLHASRTTTTPDFLTHMAPSTRLHARATLAATLARQR